jgi:hypothetical protein
MLLEACGVGIGGMRSSDWSNDWSRSYKAGVEKGSGIEEQRRSYAGEMVNTADKK